MTHSDPNPNVVPNSVNEVNESGAAVQPGGVQPGGVQPGGVQPGGVQPGGVQPGGVEPGAVEAEAAGDTGAAARLGDAVQQPDSSSDRAGGGWRRWWLAAAAVVAIAAVTAALVYGRGGESSGAADRREPVADSPPADPADLVVREGVTVEASGMVEAAPGQPVRLCNVRAGGGTGGEASSPCGFGITVTGVDLGRLVEPSQQGDVRYGFALLRGVWRGPVPGGTIEVTSQYEPTPVFPSGYPAQRPPCPEPSGGWQPDPEGASAQAIELYPYIYEHPDQFRHPDVVHPYGSAQRGTSVLVIEVVMGDVDQARREIQGRYPLGNLCVAAAPDMPSIARQGVLADQINRVLDPLSREPDSGIFALSGLKGGGPHNIGGVNTNRRWIELIMVTQRIYDALAPVGFDLVGFRPWLHPVR